MAQTNLAYDLERFEQHTPVPEQKPQISVRRERSIHPLKIMAVALDVQLRIRRQSSCSTWAKR